MTNSQMLVDKIRECGFTHTKVAKELNITRQGLWKKIWNHSEFKQSEIEALSRLLNLSVSMEKSIFFARFVG